MWQINCYHRAMSFLSHMVSVFQRHIHVHETDMVLSCGDANATIH